jgi:hypothetical protein
MLARDPRLRAGAGPLIRRRPSNVLNVIRERIEPLVSLEQFRRRASALADPEPRWQRRQALHQFPKPGDTFPCSLRRKTACGYLLVNHPFPSKAESSTSRERR